MAGSSENHDDPPDQVSGTGGGGGDYYQKGSAELATESALTLAKIQHRLKLTKKNERLVIVLVGLPGRGKSFIARKLQNFLTWRGSDCKVFNVGKYRRQAAEGACDANFFDTKNAAASNLREKVASIAMEDMLKWLDAPFEAVMENGNNNNNGGGVGSFRKDRVGIFDATNSTRARRDWVLKECTCAIKRAGKQTGVVFVESICDDEELLRENYKTKMNNSPDYKDVDPEKALADLLDRVKKYEEAYETIDDDSKSYIKIFNLSSKILVNHIYGRMAKSIVPALMAWNIGTRPVFICRSGQTMNESDRASCNYRLSRGENLGENGKAFRDELFNFMRDECLEFMRRRKEKIAFSPDMNTGTSISGLVNQFSRDEAEGTDEEYVGLDGVTPLPFPCHIMTSTMPRARQTVEWENCPYPVEMLSNLNPLDKGDFTGQELEDSAEQNPAWYSQLVADPFHTRFPGGECYADLMSRLESIVVDIEQQVGPVLVVSHVSVLQALVSYFRNSPIEECTNIALPLNTVLKFTPSKGGGWQESQHRLIASPTPSQCGDCDASSACADATNYDFVSPLNHSRKSMSTPVGSHVDIPTDKGSPPELISPMAVPPIWGDHLRRRDSSSSHARDSCRNTL